MLYTFRKCTENFGKVPSSNKDGARSILSPQNGKQSIEFYDFAG